jgi:predicted glycoside hydrolase/deacetylase ChbG (UPF0249 family)
MQRSTFEATGKISFVMIFHHHVTHTHTHTHTHIYIYIYTLSSTMAAETAVIIVFIGPWSFILEPNCTQCSMHCELCYIHINVNLVNFQNPVCVCLTISPSQNS